MNKRTTPGTENTEREEIERVFALVLGHIFIWRSLISYTNFMGGYTES
jgi:hypothetical protein